MFCPQCHNHCAISIDWVLGTIPSCGYILHLPKLELGWLRCLQAGAMKSNMLYVHVLCLALFAGLAHGFFTLRVSQSATLNQETGFYSFDSLYGGVGNTMDEQFDVTDDVDEVQNWTTETFGPDDEPQSYQYFEVTGGFAVPGTNGDYQTLVNTVNQRTFDAFIYFYVGRLSFHMQPGIIGHAALTHTNAFIDNMLSMDCSMLWVVRQTKSL